MILELNDLTARHGTVQALYGLSLRIKKGGIYALLGQNGAGKTTALRRIMGLLPPYKGRIIYDGRDISHWPTPKIARAGIGYVPERREIFTSLTVRENLSLGGQIGHGDWTIRHIIALFPDLAERLSSMAGELSGGEQQMLAIGRALMGSPRILLLDEPTEGLSAPVLNSFQSLLKNLKADGKTVLLIEQNIRFVTGVADEVALISHGQNVWQGSITDFNIKHKLQPYGPTS